MYLHFKTKKWLKFITYMLISSIIKYRIHKYKTLLSKPAYAIISKTRVTSSRLLEKKKKNSRHIKPAIKSATPPLSRVKPNFSPHRALHFPREKSCPRGSYSQLPEPKPSSRRLSIKIKACHKPAAHTYLSFAYTN